MARISLHGIIFDLGGVVVDWNPRHLYRKLFHDDAARMERFLAEVCSPEWNEMQDAGRSLNEATIERVARFPEREKEIRAYYGRWTEMIGGRVPGTAKILEKLSAGGARLFALSNWSSETFPLVRNDFAELRLFERIVLSGDFGVAKPDARFYAIALREIGIPADRLLFVDDNARNVDAGRAVGMHALHFSDAANLERELQGFEIEPGAAQVPFGRDSNC